MNPRAFDVYLTNGDRMTFGAHSWQVLHGALLVMEGDYCRDVLLLAPHAWLHLKPHTEPEVPVT